MILHSNSNKPYIKLLEMFKAGVKVAEIDITDMTGDEVWREIKMQEDQGRSWEYTTIKPYKWPSFDEEVEVSNDK